MCAGFVTINCTLLFMMHHGKVWVHDIGVHILHITFGHHYEWRAPYVEHYIGSKGWIWIQPWSPFFFFTYFNNCSMWHFLTVYFNQVSRLQSVVFCFCISNWAAAHVSIVSVNKTKQSLASVLGSYCEPRRLEPFFISSCVIVPAVRAFVCCKYCLEAIWGTWVNYLQSCANLISFLEF